MKHAEEHKAANPEVKSARAVTCGLSPYFQDVSMKESCIAPVF